MEISFTSASDHHFACITPLDQQLCVCPANVDDEALQGHGPIHSQPDDTHTVSPRFAGMRCFANAVPTEHVLYLEPHIAHVSKSRISLTYIDSEGIAI